RGATGGAGDRSGQATARDLPVLGPSAPLVVPPERRRHVVPMTWARRMASSSAGRWAGVACRVYSPMSSGPAACVAHGACVAGLAQEHQASTFYPLARLFGKAQTALQPPRESRAFWPLSGNSIAHEFIKLSANPSQGTGGACFGDSGGPDLLGDTILAVNSFVTNCRRG